MIDFPILYRSQRPQGRQGRRLPSEMFGQLRVVDRHFFHLGRQLRQ